VWHSRGHGLASSPRATSSIDDRWPGFDDPDLRVCENDQEGIVVKLCISTGMANLKSEVLRIPNAVVWGLSAPTKWLRAVFGLEARTRLSPTRSMTTRRTEPISWSVRPLRSPRSRPKHPRPSTGCSNRSASSNRMAPTPSNTWRQRNVGYAHPGQSIANPKSSKFLFVRILEEP